MLVHADDFSAAGKLYDLRKWWDTLIIMGSKLATTQTLFWCKKLGAQIRCSQNRYANLKSALDQPLPIWKKNL